MAGGERQISDNIHVNRGIGHFEVAREPRSRALLNCILGPFWGTIACAEQEFKLQESEYLELSFLNHRNNYCTMACQGAKLSGKGQ